MVMLDSAKSCFKVCEGLGAGVLRVCASRLKAKSKASEKKIGRIENFIIMVLI
jgi:hypothetical protein